MPELPEVETLRLGLVRKLVGHTILEAKVLAPKIVSGNGTKRKSSTSKTKKFILEVKNKKILAVERIAKNLILKFADKSVLIIHLKMTGQLVFVGRNKERILGGHPIKNDWQKSYPSEHSRIIFNLNNGTLYYNDVRMFGYVLYYENILDARKVGHFQNLGLDPLSRDFTLKYFTDALQKKNKTIKAVLLEQSVVTGCGNIYTDESCFASGIRPARIASKLTKQEIAKLYENIKKILRLSIKHGGTSLSDYLNVEGKKGNFKKYLQVYGRSGEKCLKCGSVLKKIIVAGRTTVYCPKCQK